MSRISFHDASLDLTSRLSLDSDDSDCEDSSNGSSPCKSIKNASHFRRGSSLYDGNMRMNSLNTYSILDAQKVSNRASPKKSRRRLPQFDNLFDLRRPSFGYDDPYSPLQSPADSVNSLASLSSCETPSSFISELDSDVGTEAGDDEDSNTNIDNNVDDGDDEGSIIASVDGDETEVYSLTPGKGGLSEAEDVAEDDVDTPVGRSYGRSVSQVYPLGHRVNRSVLGISFSHQRMLANQIITKSVPEDATPDTSFDCSLDDSLDVEGGARKVRDSYPNRDLWLPAAKVRRTQSMFATPEQMMHEQQLGNVDRRLARHSAAQGLSFLDSPECPIPTFKVRQDPFLRITHETLCRLIDGEFRDYFEDILVIDCRFEYEYEGGHIDGAINMNSKQQLEQALFNDEATRNLAKNRLLVFHCEYSAYRSPLLASHLRHCDRNMNAACYPNLFYPDVLVLDGGYSEFYNAASHRCVPQNYVGMNHTAHQSTCQRELSRFRSGMKARKFQSFGMASDPQLNDFKFPGPKLGLRSASLASLPGSLGTPSKGSSFISATARSSSLMQATQSSPHSGRRTVRHENNLFGL